MITPRRQDAKGREDAGGSPGLAHNLYEVDGRRASSLVSASKQMTSGPGPEGRNEAQGGAYVEAGIGTLSSWP
jgi:hypothetical protein